jgi:hypothetical protein
MIDRQMQSMLPKVGLLEETEGGEKEAKNDRVNKIEICHICAGIKH